MSSRSSFGTGRCLVLISMKSRDSSALERPLKMITGTRSSDLAKAKPYTRCCPSMIRKFRRPSLNCNVFPRSSTNISASGWAERTMEFGIVQAHCRCSRQYLERVAGQARAESPRADLPLELSRSRFAQVRPMVSLVSRTDAYPALRGSQSSERCLVWWSWGAYMLIERISRITCRRE